MADLENRVNLRQLAADPLTDPEFLALTSLRINDDDPYIPMHVIINHTKNPIDMKIRQDVSGEYFTYTMQEDGALYYFASILS